MLKALLFSIISPILDTRISSVRPFVRLSVTLILPPLRSETGWTGKLWSNCVLLILKKLRVYPFVYFFFWQISLFKKNQKKFFFFIFMRFFQCLSQDWAGLESSG